MPRDVCATCRFFVRVESPVTNQIGDCHLNPKIERKVEGDWCSHYAPASVAEAVGRRRGDGGRKA